LGAESGASDGFRPNQARIRQTFAKMVNVDPSEIVLSRAHDRRIVLRFRASLARARLARRKRSSAFRRFAADVHGHAKRGLEVSWIKIKDNRIRSMS
jgi:hypothetical protein